MTFTLTSAIPGTNVPIFGVMSLLGGFLLQFTMGSFYSFGNMATYMTSYMRMHGSPNVTYEDFIVVQSTWGMTQGAIMPLSGFIIGLVGEKIAMTSGCFLFSLGCALTYITLSKDLWMVAATYGFVSAFGQNIALIPTLTTAMKWFPNRKGTAMGIVVGGFGGGALVFNQIQTALVNLENYQIERTGPNAGYFTEEIVLNRVPGLLLLLAGVYLVLGLFGSLMINQPPEDWIRRKSVSKYNESDSIEMNTDNEKPMLEIKSEDDAYIHWKDALRMKEFYILWITRLSVVLITQVIAALYKAFGQTFIYDDHFLSIVGAICSFFNCSGRLIYGFIMDKTSYKVAMSLEAVLLTLLVSTFYLTSLVGVSDYDPVAAALCCLNSTTGNETLALAVTATTTVASTTSAISLLPPAAAASAASAAVSAAPAALAAVGLEADNCICQPPETALSTKIVYALWVWCIFLTFPGTFAIQPAVTTQTFGHKYGGTIYAFLFSSDIVNNLAVAALSKGIKEKYGYMGLFVIISAWGIVALVATLMYPKNPSPLRCKNKKAPTPSSGEKPIKHTEVFPPNSVPESKDQNQNQDQNL